MYIYSERYKHNIYNRIECIPFYFLFFLLTSNVWGVVWGKILERNDMPKNNRVKTIYPGVYYIERYSNRWNKIENIYYIRYRLDEKSIEEKAGKQFDDAMTPAKANRVRLEKISRKEMPNRIARRVRDTEKKWTLGKVWESYKDSRNSPDNFQRAESVFEKHIKPIFGDMLVGEIDTEMIDKFRKNKLENYEPATVVAMLARVRSLLNFAQQRGYLQTVNVTFKLPKIDNVKTEDLSDDQIKSLIEAMNEDPDQNVADIMRIALFTGMRRGEILNLVWDDIDFEKKFILIRSPKGGVSTSVPMNSKAEDVLRKREGGKSSYVFPGRFGGKRKEFRKSMNRIKEKAKLPKDFRPLHGLRHVFASYLASSGQVDLYTLQKLLTHKSPQMTQRYAHLRDEALKKASEVMANIEPLEK
jgi:integrase